MSRLSDSIFDHDLDLKYEDIDCPEWGAKLRVLEPDADRRADLMAAFVEAKADDDKMDLRTLYPLLLIVTVVDPETGEQVFSPEDADRLGRKEGRVVERLASAGLRVAALNEDGVEGPKDDSSTSLSDEATTPSPTD